jgi:hypothetical protein
MFKSAFKKIFFFFKLILFWCFEIILMADVKKKIKTKKYYFNLFLNKKYFKK